METKAYNRHISIHNLCMQRKLDGVLGAEKEEDIEMERAKHSREMNVH